MLTIRGGQIKLPNESRLVSIYSLVSSARNTNSLKSRYKWESVCANIACVNPKICQFLFKKKFGFNLDQWNCVIDCTQTYVMHPSYSEFHYYSADVLCVHADVLYDLNTHHTVCLSVDQWGHVYFPFKRKRHKHSWLASRSTFSLQMSTQMDLSSENAPQMTLHCFPCYFENCSMSQGKTIS